MKLVKQVSTHCGNIIAPMISVSKNGVMRINQPAVIQFSASEGQKLNIYQDEDSPKDWYIKFEDDGLILRKKESQGKGLLFQSSSIARDMIKSLGFETRFSAQIAKNKMIAPNVEGFYAIITSSAKGK